MSDGPYKLKRGDGGEYISVQSPTHSCPAYMSMDELEAALNTAYADGRASRDGLVEAALGVLPFLLTNLELRETGWHVSPRLTDAILALKKALGDK